MEREFHTTPFIKVKFIRFNLLAIEDALKRALEEDDLAPGLRRVNYERALDRVRSSLYPNKTQSEPAHADG